MRCFWATHPSCSIIKKKFTSKLSIIVHASAESFINKRTESGPSQLGSSRERIATANATNAHSKSAKHVERAANKDPPLMV